MSEVALPPTVVFDPPGPPTEARTRTGEGSRWPLVRDGLAVLGLGLAALCGVVLFLPADGRIARPLHDALGVLLGQAAFLLPVGLFVGGALLLVRSVRPDVALPRRRLLGLGLLTAGVLPAEDVLGPDNAGLVGAWLRGVLLDWLGPPLTALALVGLVLAGVVLTFGIGRGHLARLVGRRAAPPPATATNAGGSGPAAGGPGPRSVHVSGWVFAAPRWRGLGVGGPVGSRLRSPRAAASQARPAEPNRARAASEGTPRAIEGADAAS